jgi:CYTH domain-containing protein
MATEIERKWLLTPSAAQVLAQSFKGPDIVTQAYLATGDIEVRVRMVERVGGEDHYYLTVKAGKGISRTEVEVPITLLDASTLSALARSGVMKLRYHVDRWEFDVFMNSLDGLVLMEIELKSEDEPLPMLPYRINDFIVREVTDDPRYKNQNLAQGGIPSEVDASGKAHMAERS